MPGPSNRSSSNTSPAPPSSGHKLELSLATPDLQWKIDGLSDQLQQILEAQHQSLLVQTEFLECIKAQARQQSGDTAILASHVAVSGMVPTEPFRPADYQVLWSHLERTFAAEPAAFATDERKRAFALLHLNTNWREYYVRYLMKNRRLDDCWTTLADYIRHGR
ncbi:hypothetical protein OC845_002465 [Tilletia horrida]|nr:hypothetical protein OC845_002465 [Tilletia horrida]